MTKETGEQRKAWERTNGKSETERMEKRQEVHLSDFLALRRCEATEKRGTEQSDLWGSDQLNMITQDKHQKEKEKKKKKTETDTQKHKTRNYLTLIAPRNEYMGLITDSGVSGLDGEMQER